MAKAAAALIELDGLAAASCSARPAGRRTLATRRARRRGRRARLRWRRAAAEIAVASRAPAACRSRRWRAARRGLRDRMGAADLGHQRAAEARRAYAARRSPARSPPRRGSTGRPSTISAATAACRFFCARSPGAVRCALQRRRRARRRFPRPPRRSRRHPHFRHAVALAQGSDERRSAPHRPRLCAAVRRDRRRRACSTRWRALYPRARIEHAYASTEAGVAFAVDDGRAGFPAAGRRGRRGRDADRRRRAAHPLGPHARCAFSAPTRRRCGRRRLRRHRRHGRAARRSLSCSSAGAAASSMSAAPRCIPRRSRRRSTRTPAVQREPRLRAQEPDHRRARRRRRRAARGRRPQAGLEREILAACRARCRPQGAGAAALRRRAADDRGRKAGAPWITCGHRRQPRHRPRHRRRGWRATGFRVIAVARKRARRFDARGRTRDGVGALHFEPFDLTDIAAIPAFVRGCKRAARADLRARQQRGRRHPRACWRLCQRRHRGAAAAEHALADRADQICRARHDGGGARAHRQHCRRSSLRPASTALSVYAATKAVARRLHQSLAREVGRVGVTVNAIAPGFIDTELTHGLDADARDRVAARSALRRLAEPDDVAAMAAFLMGEGGRNITGAVMTVDAGGTA